MTSTLVNWRSSRRAVTLVAVLEMAIGLAACANDSAGTAAPAALSTSATAAPAAASPAPIGPQNLAAFCQSPPPESKPDGAKMLKTVCIPELLSKAGGAPVTTVKPGLYQVMLPAPLAFDSVCKTGTARPDFCRGLRSGDTISKIMINH